MPGTSLPHNPDAQPFWDGAKQHRLLLKKCGSCGMTNSEMAAGAECEHAH